MQVTPTGIFHIHRSTSEQHAGASVQKQLLPVDGKIVKATANARQLAVVLQSQNLVYYELTQQLELAEVSRTYLDSEVVCMHVAAVPEGR